jgi:hypothetical protein
VERNLNRLDLALYANIIGASLHLIALSRMGYQARRQPKVVVSVDTSKPLITNQSLEALEHLLRREEVLHALRLGGAL